MNNKKCLNKNEEKKQFSKSKNYFTFHLRLVYDSFSHSLIIVYSIFHSWKTIVFDEFQKESHKKFDSNFESIEVIHLTISDAKISMSRMKNARFLA
jgi:hypothetical protein